MASLSRDLEQVPSFGEEQRDEGVAQVEGPQPFEPERGSRASPGGELQVHGSGSLTRWLLENDLVDEMNLLVAPVVVGQGTRLFPDFGPDLALDLVESRVFPKDITLQVYWPAGRPQYAD